MTSTQTETTRCMVIVNLGGNHTRRTVTSALRVAGVPYTYAAKYRENGGDRPARWYVIFRDGEQGKITDSLEMAISRGAYIDFYGDE